VNIGQNLSDFGAIWPDSQAGARKYLPRISVAQGPTGHLGFLSLFDQNNFRFGSTVSHNRGKHNFRFGAEAQRDTVAQFNDHDGVNLSFDGRASSLGRGQNIFGYAMADFVMGRLSGFNTSGILDYNLSNWAYFFFAQDEWKLTPRLTLTPGLRYELYSPVSETNNKASAFFFGHRSEPVFERAPASGFPRRRRYSVRLHQTGSEQLCAASRLAYDVFGDGKTVVRGGFGVYYMYNPMQIRMWNAEGNPWRPAASGGEALLRDPVGYQQTVVYNQPPTPFNPDPTCSLSASPDERGGIQRGLRHAVQPAVERVRCARFRWKGHLGSCLCGQPGQAPSPDAARQLSRVRTRRNARNIEQRRPDRGYGHVSIIHSRANSWYDALQLTADTRLFKA
jgi:hypothetical protein